MEGNIKTNDKSNKVVPSNSALRNTCTENTPQEIKKDISNKLLTWHYTSQLKSRTKSKLIKLGKNGNKWNISTQSNVTFDNLWSQRLCRNKPKNLLRGNVPTMKCHMHSVNKN